MTDLANPIYFNTASGSDTAASGSGPATAVTGTGASLNATTTVDLSADTPDLSGVRAGDLLWVQSSSGMQFSVIASVDDVADTVTVDTAFAVTETGRTWAIGGKRATLEDASSRQLLQDLLNINSVIVELEDDQTINSYVFIKMIAIGDGNTPSRFRGSAGSIKTITQTAADYHFRPDSNFQCYWENLRFENSNATTNASCQVFWNRLRSQGWHFIDCVFGDATNTIYSVQYDNSGSWAGSFLRCKFQSTTEYAFKEAGHLPVKFVGCLFDSCYGGVNQYSSGYGYTGGSYSRCVFRNITTEAIRNNAVYNQYLGLTDVEGCIFDNCGTGFMAGRHMSIPMLSNNIFVDCTTAIDLNVQGQALGGLITPFMQGNAFYNCTTDVDSLPNTLNVDFEKITLTADPFVDKANSDYNLNADAGGGADLRSNNYTVGG